MFEHLTVDTSDEEQGLRDEWRTYVESFLLQMGKFSIEKSYGSENNFRFVVVPKILIDEPFGDTVLQLFILEVKTRTVAAVAEHEEPRFKAAELKSFLKEILEQLQKSKDIIAVRMMVE